MKEFLIAVTSLVLCLSAVIFSFFYTADSIAKIAENIEGLPLTIDEDMKKDTSEEYLGCVGNCIELLEKRQVRLSLFITHRELDEIKSLLVAVKAALESRDTGHYASAVASLRDSLERLSDSESLKLSAIF